MRLRWTSGDVAALWCLLALILMFGAMSYVAYSVTRLWHVRPLGIDAPLDRFSEARAVEHVRHLSVDIDGRQEGKPGLKKAAQYIKQELEEIAGRAGQGIRVDIEETLVAGSFNMKFLHRSLSLGYKNHTNIIMRYGEAFNQSQFTGSSYVDSSSQGHSEQEFPLIQPGFVSACYCMSYIEFGAAGSQIGETGFRGSVL